MANKLTVHEHDTINCLKGKGRSIRDIARMLRISRNTVRNHLRALKPPDPGLAAGFGVQTDPLSPPGSGQTENQTDPLSTAGKTGRNSHCSIHADLILKKVGGHLTAQRIYQDLKLETSFAGSYCSVKRYVRKLRRTDPKLVYRIEVQPAEEVQVDFGTGPTLVGPDGKRTKTWIFREVLSHSRKAYSEAVRRQDTETFLRCLENGFRAFGGATLTVNLDNLKAAVLKADWYDPQFNPKLVDFARHYGTTILPCIPRTPEHKGKVENSVAYVKDNALAGRKFESLAAVNLHLANWEKTVADVRIHGTTKRQVAELFSLEKPFLLPLPASLFPCFREGPRTVHSDGNVEVERAYYHVPPEHFKHQVWVRFDGREVRILIQLKDESLKQIQVHRRLEPGKFTNARGIGGGQGSIQVNMDYWLGRACNLGTSCEQWARAVAKNRGFDGMRTLMGLVGLINRHSFAAVNRACERASAKGTWRLRDINALLQAREIQTQITFEEHHPLIRDLSEYGLFIQAQAQTQNT